MMKMTNGSILTILLICTAVSATSWTNKEKERNYRVEEIKHGQRFDWTKINEKCEDEHPQCKSFTKLCKYKIVTNKCKDTCGYCRAQAAPVDCKITKHGCCWDNRTIAKGPHNKGCPACVDKFSECKLYSSQCSKQQFQLMCPVTCGIKCSQCIDNQYQAKICPLYKRYGFCKLSPDLMEKMCSKTCGFCTT